MDHSFRQTRILRILMAIQAICLFFMLQLSFPTGNAAEDLTDTGTEPPAVQILTLPATAAEPTVTISPSAVTQTISPPVNILLIGSDHREGETAARADSAIVCTFRKGEPQLTMTSFLRDLYVEIPGYGGDRINAAYAYGGRDLLKQTLETNFDICIDGCLEVDFSRFAQIIDTLGGITLQLRQDEADAVNATVPGTLAEGTQHLNGNQALAYSRIRNLDADGDFSRTCRQRTVMTAVMEQFRNMSLLRTMAVLIDILPLVSTDLEQKQIVSLALQLFPLLSELKVTGCRVPEDGDFRYEKIRGMDVLYPNLTVTREKLDFARAEE